MICRSGIALLYLLALTSGCATVGQRIHGIDNFATVEPGLYRGAQPSAAGVDELARRGVKTVIDLRDDALPEERTLVLRAGMSYINIPTDAAIVSPAKIDQCLEHLKTAPRPIFVHCRMGRDRTGLEIAMYRIEVLGWPREKAIRELYAHGYNWMLFPVIERYLRSRT